MCIEKGKKAMRKLNEMMGWNECQSEEEMSIKYEEFWKHKKVIEIEVDGEVFIIRPIGEFKGLLL